MKLIVLHFPGLLNYGTGMMGINSIHYLQKHMKAELEFTCDFTPNTSMQSLLDEIGIASLKLHQLPLPNEIRLPRNRFIRKAIQISGVLMLMQIREALRHDTIEGYDGIIILGGDDLSEYYGRDVWQRLLQLAVWSFQKPVILLGQSMGPFHYWLNRAICRLLMRRCHIFARDKWTVRYLADEFSLKSNIHNGADLAFLDLPCQHDPTLWQDLVKTYNLKRDDYITLVISALQGRYYTGDRIAYLRAWHQIISSLLNHRKLENKRICLLAHTFGHYGDEGLLIQDLLHCFNAQETKRLIQITEKILPTRARLVLGNGIFTITGRMHAAVSTFQMGKPAISLAYSKKYYGVIGGNLGRDDLIIDADHQESWADGSIHAQVLSKVDYLLENYARICTEITAAVQEQKRLALESCAEATRIIESAGCI